MVLQVLLLMVLIVYLLSPSSYLELNNLQPLRTIMNYQYRYGTTFTAATQTLYQDGGLRRYYQGISAALVQGLCFTYPSPQFVGINLSV